MHWLNNIPRRFWNAVHNNTICSIQLMNKMSLTKLNYLFTSVLSVYCQYTRGDMSFAALLSMCFNIFYVRHISTWTKALPEGRWSSSPTRLYDYNYTHCLTHATVCSEHKLDSSVIDKFATNVEFLSSSSSSSSLMDTKISPDISNGCGIWEVTLLIIISQWGRTNPC